MHRPVRALPPLILLLVMGACGLPGFRSGSSDTNGSAPGAPGGQGEGGDALSPGGLRLLDPCGLVDPQVLGRFGTADKLRLVDFNRCSTVITTPDGRRIIMALRVGESLSSADVTGATADFAGLRGAESTVEGSCFVSLLGGRAGDEQLGIVTQVGDSGGDPCIPAREIATAAARRVTSDPPLRDPAPGSILGLDPCTVPGDELLRTVLPAPGEPARFGVHQCSWATGGLTVTLKFRRDYAPTVPGSPGAAAALDLGGIPAVLTRPAGDVPACWVSWLHRETGRGSGGVEGELVDVEVADYLGGSGVDVCVAAESLARALAPRLPRP